MRTAIVTIRGVSPYSAGRVLQERKRQASETDEEHETRCWKQRLNVDENGQGYIPPMAFTKAFQLAAKRYAGKIEGRGSETWTKHFDAGLMCMTPLKLDVTLDTVQGEWLFVPSDGVSGSGKRVMKCFPKVDRWGGDVEIHVLDPNITEKVFEFVADHAFKLVGIGRFRPEKRGFYGRAAVEKITWRQ